MVDKFRVFLSFCPPSNLTCVFLLGFKLFVGPVAGDGWDVAAAPVPGVGIEAVPAVAPSGWD